METYEELKKQQEKLNKELVKCPYCGVICQWEELIDDRCISCNDEDTKP
jgi:hypothetical protein